MRIVEGQMTEIFKECLSQVLLPTGYIVGSMLPNQWGWSLTINKGSKSVYTIILRFVNNTEIAGYLQKGSNIIYKGKIRRDRIGSLAGLIAAAVKQDSIEHSDVSAA
jgi:hypothetical protein